MMSDRHALFSDAVVIGDRAGAGPLLTLPRAVLVALFSAAAAAGAEPCEAPSVESPGVPFTSSEKTYQKAHKVEANVTTILPAVSSTSMFYEAYRMNTSH